MIDTMIIITFLLLVACFTFGLVNLADVAINGDQSWLSKVTSPPRFGDKLHIAEHIEVTTSIMQTRNWIEIK